MGLLKRNTRDFGHALESYLSCTDRHRGREQSDVGELGCVNTITHRHMTYPFLLDDSIQIPDSRAKLLDSLLCLQGSLLYRVTIKSFVKLNIDTKGSGMVSGSQRILFARLENHLDSRFPVLTPCHLYLYFSVHWATLRD